MLGENNFLFSLICYSYLAKVFTSLYHEKNLKVITPMIIKAAKELIR